MSLLDTVEPDAWKYNLGQRKPTPELIFLSKQKRFVAGVPFEYWTEEPLYSRETVESLLEAHRKQVLLEAADFVDDGEYDHHGIAAALRRMAESDKTTMEGEN